MAVTVGIELPPEGGHGYQDSGERDKNVPDRRGIAPRDQVSHDSENGNEGEGPEKARNNRIRHVPVQEIWGCKGTDRREPL